MQIPLKMISKLICQDNNNKSRKVTQSNNKNQPLLLPFDQTYYPMLKSHPHQRQNSFTRDIFKTQRSLPLLPTTNPKKSRNLPLHLPQINPKKNRYSFYDQLSLSPEYIKISKTQDNTKLSSRLKSSRVDSSVQPSILSSSRRKQQMLSFNLGSRILPLQKLALQDRIVQKYEQNDLKYKKLISNIRRKVKSHHEKQNKQGIELIYDRLMKLL